MDAIIRRSVKSLKGIYDEKSQDAKYAALEKFMEAYIFRAPEMFAEARYKATKQSLDRARRPAALPDEADVTTLMTHVKSELRRLTSSNRDCRRVPLGESAHGLPTHPVQWQERRGASSLVADRMT